LPTTTKKTPASNPKVELYETLIATIPNLERKGDANPYTAINGNMFSLLNQSSRLAIRLPEDKRAEFLKKYKTALFEAYGTVMQEYVAIPDALLKNTKELKKYLRIQLRIRPPVQWPGVHTKGVHECDQSTHGNLRLVEACSSMCSRELLLTIGATL
jgi:hypothetical protein